MMPDGQGETISVVMPVYNAMPHLDAAVESILGQTYDAFEFVILDDASTDGSTRRLREWAARDPRIRLIEVQKNLGPALSSERVARAAAMSIVARMDADDISYPDRLAKQIKILEDNPHVGVVGGLAEAIDTQGRIIRGAEPWRVAHHSLFPPFGNGPMMYRRAVFEKAGGYRQECVYWEDQDLLIRMSAVAQVMVIPHAVYQVRQSNSSTRVNSEQVRVERAVDLMFRSRQRLAHDQDYEDLLRHPPANDAKLDPRVFISLGSITLWGGGRPRLFRRLLRRGDLSLNFRTVASLVWTAWASVSPATLRACLRALVIARNLYASAAIDVDRPIYWSTPLKHRIAPIETERAT
ncbi:MAG: glycosyltransferase family 2 protein [Pseudomonadota bacterium]|nr:glycosyltransferase family 2 protein [Pseudomonadota bacterium]